jgi:hypothetical protein
MSQSATLLRRGDRVTVHLTEKHELGESEKERVAHPAKFLQMHAGGLWADVELEEPHAGGTRTLAVPLAYLEKDEG